MDSEYNAVFKLRALNKRVLICNTCAGQAMSNTIKIKKKEGQTVFVWYPHRVCTAKK